MIRQPFNSAIGRTRADINRVTDGIAASLRAFSTAQQLAAAPQDQISSSNNGNNSQSTGRQRAAAAFSDLVEMNKGNPVRSSSNSGPAFKKLDLRSEPGSIAVPSTFSPGGPNIIRGGIRGGFRGRGGFSRGGRGRGRAGGNARGGRGGRGGGRGGRNDKGDESGVVEDDWSPEVQAMREAKEIGSSHEFDPSISKSDLAGWGPAVAVTGSSIAKDETAIRQARILGGGQPFHPLNSLGRDDMWKQYTKGIGVFFPTEDMKKRSAEVMGLEAFPPVPKETKDAVLQSALLGTYRGPQYADLKDTLSAVRNYVRRDASWNSDAEQRVEEKVRSLLPGGKTGPAKAPGGARAIT